MVMSFSTSVGGANDPLTFSMFHSNVLDSKLWWGRVCSLFALYGKAFKRVCFLVFVFFFFFWNKLFPNFCKNLLQKKLYTVNN